MAFALGSAESLPACLFCVRSAPFTRYKGFDGEFIDVSGLPLWLDLKIQGDLKPKTLLNYNSIFTPLSMFTVAHGSATISGGPQVSHPWDGDAVE